MMKLFVRIMLKIHSVKLGKWFLALLGILVFHYLVHWALLYISLCNSVFFSFD